MLSANGASPTRITSHAAADNEPHWSPDGSRIAFISERDGNFEIYLGPTTLNYWPAVRLTNNVARDTSPDFSPDGTKIAFRSNRDANDEIYTMNADGSGQTRLSNFPSGEQFPSWGPFWTRKLLIGSGGLMGTNASGFLFSQRDERLRSVLIFDAVTRTSARVKAQTGLGDGLPNVIFNISGDSLNKIAFLNFTDTLPKVITVVGAGQPDLTATDAIVTFGVTKGIISSVLPYTSNRSGKPSITTEGGTRVIRGRFFGAWDASGANLAAAGATEVRVDAKTGDLLSVR